VTRDAAAIGAGLDPVRAARPIREGERIHVIGAAGAGASAAALLARAAGAVVTACDAGGPSPYSVALEEAGIAVAPRHDPGHVTTDPSPERLAVTKALTAIDPDHPELRAAREHGIPVEPWQQVIADAASGRTLVAIAGTHGKSTTAGWLVHVLVHAGLDPSAFVGALLPAADTGRAQATARIGRGVPFVVEADEYAGNFDAYRPDIVVLTSAEWDHPDVFADAGAVHHAFVRWLREMPGGGTLIANVAEEGVAAVVEGLADMGVTVIAVGLADANADGARAGDAPIALAGRILAEDPDGTTVALDGLDPLGRPITARLPTAGRHNAANALGVVAAASTLGVAPEAIVRGLETFDGVGRRLERKGETSGVVVYDDYAHHPTAIRATIAALRQREPARRLWAVYEPLTYHRTAALASGFADALATADAVVIADIWPGRDPDTTIASSADLAAAVAQLGRGIPVEAPGSVDATAEWLAGKVRPGDAVLVMGGGHSYRIATGLLRRLEEEAGR
jgi:UDP-N-acetylmuramate--alanine ligase